MLQTDSSCTTQPSGPAAWCHLHIIQTAPKETSRCSITAARQCLSGAEANTCRLRAEAARCQLAHHRLSPLRSIKQDFTRSDKPCRKRGAGFPWVCVTTKEQLWAHRAQIRDAPERWLLAKQHYKKQQQKKAKSRPPTPPGHMSCHEPELCKHHLFFPPQSCQKAADTIEHCGITKLAWDTEAENPLSQGPEVPPHSL